MEQKKVIDNGKIVLFCYKFLLFLILLATLLITVGTIALAHDELFEELLSSSLRLALPLLLASLVFVFIVLFYRWVEQLEKKGLMICSIILFLLIITVFVILLANFNSSPYTDALNVQDLASYLAATGEHTVTESLPHGSYYVKVSNNNLITLLFVCFFKFLSLFGVSNFSMPLHILATLAMIIFTVFMYLTGLRMGGLRSAVKILILCALNPLYYILTFWVYTNVLSIPFTAAVVYFGICTYQEQRTKRRLIYSALTVLCAVIGFFIRATAAFPLIALVILVVLWMLKEKKRRRVVLQCLIVGGLVGIISYKGISAWNNSYFSEVSGHAIPITHFLMTGSQGTGTLNPDDVAYTQSFEDQSEKINATLQKAIENYKSFGPAEYLSFVYNKTLITWCHGDGADLLSKSVQDTKQTKLYSWILGDRSDAFSFYAYAFRIANLFLMLAALGSLLGKKKVNAYQFLFATTFFGGLLYNCLVSAKGTYQLPFVFFFLLIGMEGGDVLASRVDRASETLFAKKHRTTVTAVLCGVLCICIMSYHYMVYTEVTLHDWTVRSSGGSYSSIKTDDGEYLLTQEFYASKAFNRISVKATANDAAKNSECGYKFELLDENGQVLYETVLYASDIPSNGLFTINVGEIVPEGRQKYMIQLEKTEEGSGNMYFMKRGNSSIDMYEGELTVNGTALTNDMYMSVYRKFQSMWCSRTVGLLINGGMFLAAVLLYFWMKKAGGMFRPKREVQKSKND